MNCCYRKNPFKISMTISVGIHWCLTPNFPFGALHLSTIWPFLFIMIAACSLETITRDTNWSLGHFYRTGRWTNHCRLIIACRIYYSCGSYVTWHFYKCHSSINSCYRNLLELWVELFCVIFNQSSRSNRHSLFFVQTGPGLLFDSIMLAIWAYGHILLGFSLFQDKMMCIRRNSYLSLP